MKGWMKRDEEGKIIIDTNGFVTIACEDESIVFQLHLSEIDEKAEQMCFNVNGKDIYIDVYPLEVVDNDVENERIDIEEDKTVVPSTSKNGNAIFPWCDSSTKIFLKEYKLKKELVKNRKLKNMKNAYMEISKSLQDNGFNVSPLQVENRFKTLKRAYKNMILHNRRNGRGKYICSYEQDLDEIFSYKNFIADLQDAETKGDETESESTRSSRITNSVLSNEHSPSKNSEHIARLEVQHTKLLENVQSNQRVLKNLITKMENKTKNFNDMQNKMLQICVEMRDMQKEAYARAEEQRQKANMQREIMNNLLDEMLTVLKSKKEA
ncbi:putative leucine-rich repeat-containing protein DDB_G0290503 [Linepithema humile]|uniref:putative leucine-rich repeat-containing protein DDB_G0290503 n=1 Tax=Linepithema humile TaxID=83485 RepID=UPI00062304BE|nr:PREDICTED: uncharacterized protein LOC105678275 [Linepithema humile]